MCRGKAEFFNELLGRRIAITLDILFQDEIQRCQMRTDDAYQIG